MNGEPELFSYEVAFVRADMRELVADLEAAHIRVHDLGALGDFQVAWTARLRRLLVEGRYDVVHAHSPYAAGLARLVTRTLAPAKRPRLVYTEHSSWDHNTTASRVLGLTTSHWDDVRIAVAQANRDSQPPRLRRDMRVIRHGIDVAKTLAESGAVPPREALGIPPGDLMVLSVANLREAKGYRTLLPAARAVLDAGVPATFLAAGSGELLPALEAERDRLGLGERFRFLGQRADARALIAASDVMVLASDWECMPVVVMEAFALGTPVVATAVGELPDVIEDGVSGLLVPPRQPELLAAALRRILTDAPLRESIGRAAAASADQFDVSYARREVESVYASLASR